MPNLKFRGRNYRLYNRVLGGPYQVRVQAGGERIALSTKTADLALARVRAKELIRDVLDGGYERRIKVEAAINRSPSLADIFEVYRGGERLVRQKTATDNANSLVLVVSEALSLTRGAALEARVGCLDSKLARAFLADRQGRESVDYVSVLAANTSANSTLQQAKSVFSRRMLAIYKEKGLVIPESIQTFLSTPRLKEPSHRYSDNPIPPGQIEEMNRDLPALKERDERLWSIHLMIRLMGLRASEIFRAKKDWLIDRSGRTYLVIRRRAGEAAPKRSEGEVPVPEVLLKWFRQQPGDYLIPAGSQRERRDLIYYDHSKWVRERMPGRTKTNHELRKWAGSQVAQKTNSWERAAEFLRIDIDTAKAHYLSFVSPGEGLDLDDLS